MPRSGTSADADDSRANESFVTMFNKIETVRKAGNAWLQFDI